MESAPLLVPLTFKLIAIPEHAWPRLTAACDRREPMPSPMAHAAAVAACSVLASLLGAALASEASVGSVAIAVMAAAAGYLGSAAMAVQLAPRLIKATPKTQIHLPRYASATAIPVIASGTLTLIPLTLSAALAAIFGVALSLRSGFLGARDLLGLEGQARKRAATTTATLASTPVLLAALFRLTQ